MLLLSLAGHGAIYAFMSRQNAQPRKISELVELELAPVKPPPPPPPRAVPESRPPRPVEPALPRKVQAARVPAPVPAAPPPPPPPGAAPPSTARPAVVKIGISLGSTVASGGFSVGVGNSLYGKADEKAADPAEVAPNPRGRYVPPTQVSTLPRLIEQPKAAYTAEARKAGVEGRVLLLLRIDEEGRVSSAKVLSGPGYGLEGEAERNAHRLRFEPARVDGEPVATEIRFTYTFVLD